MAPKNVFIAVFCATLLAWNGAAAADAYQADEFLRLDLSKAVLSPKPLGPVSGFAPVPMETPVAVETSADRGSAESQAKLEPKAESNIVVRQASVVHRRASKAHGPVHPKLARRHTNPLDAQAFDTRIQVWPCRSGGICDWKRH
jgi:hypothetical protein